MRIRLCTLLAASLLACPIAQAQAPPEPFEPVDTSPSEGVYAEPADAAPYEYDSDIEVDDGGDLDDDGDDDRKKWSLGLRIGAWQSLFEATVEASDNVTPGTEIRLTSDLDLEEYANTPLGEVFFTTPIISVYIDAWRSEREGKTTLDADLTFDGVTFSRGVPVEAEFTIETLGGVVEVTPFTFEGFELGFLVGVRYYKLQGEIRSREAIPLIGQLRASDTTEGPVPSVGLAAAIFLGPFEIFGRVHGFAVDYRYESRDSDVEARYLDAEVGFLFNLGDHFALGASYKLLYLDIEEVPDDRVGPNRNQLEISQHGPLFFARLRF